MSGSIIVLFFISVGLIYASALFFINNSYSIGKYKF